MKTKITILSLLLISSFGYSEAVESTSANMIFSSIEIKKMNAQMLVDLLNKIQGVKASESFVSIQGSTTNEVLVLFDGRPLSDSMSGTVNLGGITTENIDKIEIIKGAGAALYGNNTSGGVIIITSKKTGKSFVNKIDLARGTLNTDKYNINFGKKFDSFGVSFGAGHEKSDGHRLNGDSETNSIKADVNKVIFKDFDTTLSGNYISDKGGTSGRITKPTLKARYEKESAGLLLFVKHNSMDGKAYFNANEDFNTDIDKNLDTYLKTRTIGIDIKHNVSLSFIGKSTVGITFENRNADATNSGNHDENLYGVYGIKNYIFGDFGLNFGVRFNSHSEFGNSFNPELGFLYKNGDYKTDLKISKSSKTPTFKQRYYESSTQMGNPDLEMESATNFQLSNSMKINDKLSANLNIFYSKVDNGISGAYDSNGIYTYENITSSTRKGFESGFDYKVNDIVSMDLSYLYLIFRNDDTGLFLAAKPKHKIQSDIYMKYKNFKANLGAYYVSESFNDSKNKEILDGHFVADTKIEYSYGNKKFYVEIENLFDKPYDAHIGYPTAGRTYLFGINYIF